MLWRKQAIELHSDDGTQRLELPVSRTTLKDWGGVPRVISEKSDESVMRNDTRDDAGDGLTLCVQEVVDQDVVTSLGLDRGFLEHHLLMTVRANAHVLLAQGVNVGIDVVGVLRWDISQELRWERS